MAIQGLTALCIPPNAFGSLSVDSVIKRITLYHDSVSQCPSQKVTTNIYAGFHINVDKRNSTMMLIPSMYSIAKGDREYVTEFYTTLTLEGGKVKEVDTKVSTGTVPKNRDVMTIMKQFALPTIYSETIYGEYLLSPCNKYNRKVYRYRITKLTAGRAEVVFRPKVRNTQLVSGKFIMDLNTGKILSIKFRGELDMVKFIVSLKMSSDDNMPLSPKTSHTNIKFSFLGNKTRTQCITYYNCQKQLPTTIHDSHDRSLMDSLRPIRLSPAMEKVYERKFGSKLYIVDTTDSITPNTDDSTAADSVQQYEPMTTNSKFLNKLGDYFIERIKGSFGTKAQGSYRLSPLINPLYLGYSNKKGITYKMKLNAGYNFNDISNISMTVNAGYSFKQRQLYTKIPMRYTINRKLYVETKFGIGNRITSSEILDRIKHEKYDSIRWDEMNLNYFKDMYWKIKSKYSFNNKWSIIPGIAYHRRSAVDKSGFILSGEPHKYHSFAPLIKLQYSPLAERGPIISIDYERGIKGVIHSNTNYERVETDVAWKKELHRMRLFSMKVGYGLYTSRSKGAYFLDYTNFHYENIPGGWDDDWTGEFQLLNSNWYNASRYYLRGNFTYESPLLILSKLPLVGRYIEMERIYSNILFTDQLHPYIECGYGMTNKWFSTGAFFSVSNKKFGEVGIRFGLELFRDW